MSGQAKGGYSRQSGQQMQAMDDETRRKVLSLQERAKKNLREAEKKKREQQRIEAQRRAEEENRRKEILEERKRLKQRFAENMRENIRKHRVGKKTSSAENSGDEDAPLIATPDIPPLLGEVGQTVNTNFGVLVQAPQRELRIVKGHEVEVRRKNASDDLPSYDNYSSRPHYPDELTDEKDTDGYQDTNGIYNPGLTLDIETALKLVKGELQPSKQASKIPAANTTPKRVPKPPIPPRDFRGVPPVPQGFSTDPSTHSGGGLYPTDGIDSDRAVAVLEDSPRASIDNSPFMETISSLGDSVQLAIKRSAVLDSLDLSHSGILTAFPNSALLLAEQHNSKAITPPRKSSPPVEAHKKSEPKHLPRDSPPPGSQSARHAIKSDREQMLDRYHPKHIQPMIVNRDATQSSAVKPHSENGAVPIIERGVVSSKKPGSTQRAPQSITHQQSQNSSNTSQSSTKGVVNAHDKQAARDQSVPVASQQNTARKIATLDPESVVSHHTEIPYAPNGIHTISTSLGHKQQTNPVPIHTNGHNHQNLSDEQSKPGRESSFIPAPKATILRRSTSESRLPQRSASISRPPSMNATDPDSYECQEIVSYADSLKSHVRPQPRPEFDAYANHERPVAADGNTRVEERKEITETKSSTSTDKMSKRPDGKPTVLRASELEKRIRDSLQRLDLKLLEAKQRKKLESMMSENQWAEPLQKPIDETESIQTEGDYDRKAKKREKDLQRLKPQIPSYMLQDLHMQSQARTKGDSADSQSVSSAIANQASAHQRHTPDQSDVASIHSSPAYLGTNPPRAPSTVPYGIIPRSSASSASSCVGSSQGPYPISINRRASTNDGPSFGVVNNPVISRSPSAPRLATNAITSDTTTEGRIIVTDKAREVLRHLLE